MINRCFVLSLALAITSIAGASEIPPEVDAALNSWRLHDAEASGKSAQLERARAKGLVDGKSWAPTQEPSPIDVSRYSIELFLDFSQEVVSGSVEIDLNAVEPNISTVVIDAWAGLRILGVTLLKDSSYVYDSPAELQFNHEGDLLTIDLPRPLAEGDELGLLVNYGGRAGYRGQGINWDYHGGSKRVAWTMAEPFGARIWWPCNDRPDDKAVVDLTVTAPSEYVVASNGLIEDTVDNGDGTTTTAWASIYPVASYLVVMDVADYVFSEETYVSEDGTTMPVVLYAFPEVAEQAEDDLAVTPAQIETMATYFGEYPFIEEKYGNCTANFGGGMEHQTLTTLSANAIGTSWMPWLNVHELGHQWWGDWVTCADWRDLWLNEGFATLTEWLWAEHLGESTLQNYLEDSDQIGLFLGPVYDNPVPFSGTVYDKGAWVLRMMRHLLGDEVFFDGVAAFRQAHPGEAATSEDLRAAFESVSGKDLEKFFQQWVYGKNRPHFTYSWETIEGPAIRLTVNQIQSNADLFEMPLEVRVTTTSGIEDHRIELSAIEQQTLEIQLAAQATGLQFDPNRWSLFLASALEDPVLDLGPEHPGPIDAGFASVTSPSTMSITLTNLGGSPLEIYDWGFANSGSEFTITSPTETPDPLGPGDEIDLEITFRAGGIGTRGNWLWIFSNDPLNSGFSYTRIEGHGTVFPGTVLQYPSSRNFGDVPVHGFAETEIELINMGETSVTMNAQIEGDQFTLLTPVPPVSEPGTRQNLLLRFSPDTVGDHDGRLVFQTDDPIEPTIEIPLRGTGISAPHILVAPSTLTLGIVAEGQGATLVISNQGTEPLQVDEILFDGPFALGEHWAIPANIDPGEALELLIVSTSTQSSREEGSLRIRSNDPGLPWATIPINAISVEEAVDQADQMVIPASASTGGLGGSWWSTDLVLLNTGETNAAADLVFGPPGPPFSEPIRTVTVPAGSQRTLEDVVAELGYQGAGGITVTTTHPEVVLTTRTAAQADGQTFGQTIGPVRRADAQHGQQFSILAGLSSGSGFHTNFGIFNLSEHRVTATFEVFGSDGSHLGDLTLSAPAGAFAQKVDALEELGAGDLRGTWARVSSGDTTDLFTCYASVVDDLSHDPTFIAPTMLDHASTHIVVPTVAAQPGFNDTRWATELTLVNPADQETDASLIFHTADGSTTSTEDRTIPAGAALYAGDLVRNVFDSEGAGWLEIQSTQPLVAGCRIFNNSVDGTFGQFVPTQPLQSESQPTVVIPGLLSDRGFRTNLGLTSMSDSDTTINLTMHSDEGEVLGTEEVLLPAGSFVQLVKVLQQNFGYEGSAWAEINPTDSQVPFAAHASVVDGSTGDPSFIPATSAGQNID